MKDGYGILKAYPHATQQPGRTRVHVLRWMLSPKESSARWIVSAC